MTACIVGWAHTQFGKLEDPDIESLFGRVAMAAIHDAGIEPAEVDAVRGHGDPAAIMNKY
jgi:acetyl-CoA C-acetyltransferase